MGAKRASSDRRAASANASIVPPSMRIRMALTSPASAALDITPRPWLSIIGIGEDGIEGLSPVARRLIEAAAVVVGGERHLALAGPLVNGERVVWPSPIEAAFPRILALRGRPVVILASGDPFHFGVGK